MIAGPELDARLAEAMGWEWWRSSVTGRRALYAPGKQPSWMNARADGSEPVCYDVADDGGMVPRSLFSTDVSAAIAAAEEMRKAGRIAAWSITVWPNWENVKGQVYLLSGVNLEPCDADGDTPAHALTLALLAAL
jgi:hypothetical protein